MLRGLNAAEGYESQILDYLADVDQLAEPDELEDLSTILGYASGATERGILVIDPKEFEIVHEKLLARIDAHLPKHPSFIRCALLFIRGFVELKDWYIHPSGDKSTETFEASVRKSVTTWTILLKEASEVQIFPIERPSNTVNFLFTHFNTEWFSDFVNKLDALIAERVGAERTAEALAIRGSALLEDEQHFRALDVFHQAFDFAQSTKSQSITLTIGLQLAELYHFLGLHHAAKYYALASAFASLSLSDDDQPGALKAAEKIRSAIEALQFEAKKNSGEWVSVTACIGIATAEGEHDGMMTAPKDLLLAADSALYQAKREWYGWIAVATSIPAGRMDGQESIPTMAIAEMKDQHEASGQHIKDGQV